jgi:hypothetical protein
MMEAFQQPTSAGATSGTPSESKHAGQPPSPSSCDGALGPAEELLTEWEDPWIDFGGEG